MAPPAWHGSWWMPPLDGRPYSDTVGHSLGFWGHWFTWLSWLRSQTPLAIPSLGDLACTWDRRSRLEPKLIISNKRPWEAMYTLNSSKESTLWKDSEPLLGLTPSHLVTQVWFFSPQLSWLWNRLFRNKNLFGGERTLWRWGKIVRCVLCQIGREKDSSWKDGCRDLLFEFSQIYEDIEILEVFRPFRGLTAIARDCSF
jgi:hypothetical protein